MDPMGINLHLPRWRTTQVMDLSQPDVNPVMAVGIWRCRQTVEMFQGIAGRHWDDLGKQTLGGWLEKDSKAGPFTAGAGWEFLKKMVVFSVREGPPFPPPASWASVDPRSLFSTFGVFESAQWSPFIWETTKKGCYNKPPSIRSIRILGLLALLPDFGRITSHFHFLIGDHEVF